MPFEMYVDSDGRPYSEYGNYGGVEVGTQRSILAVAERGLWYWNTFRLGGGEEMPALLSYDWNKWPVNKDAAPRTAEQARGMMLNCADWLADNFCADGEFKGWIYPYDHVYGTKKGWRSSHAQAVALQCLARAAAVADDRRRERYSAIVRDGVAAFDLPLSRGGLCVMTQKGHRWFEKMADPANEQPKILNGALFSVLGLLDVAARADVPRARELALSGLEAVLETMPMFDLGDWSAYDGLGRRASPHYHAIHIAQLKRLVAHLGDARCLQWQERFETYEKRAKPAKRRRALPRGTSSRR